jgi:hypothetical protein
MAKSWLNAVNRRWHSLRWATGWGAAFDPGDADAKGVEAVLAKPYQLSDLLMELTKTDTAA